MFLKCFIALKSAIFKQPWITFEMATLYAALFAGLNRLTINIEICEVRVVAITQPINSLDEPRRISRTRVPTFHGRAWWLIHCQRVGNLKRSIL